MKTYRQMVSFINVIMIIVLCLFFTQQGFASDGQVIYFADANESKGSIYKVENNTESVFYTRPSGNLYSFALSPDGVLYYVNANAFNIYKLADTAETLIYTHTTYVRDVAFDVSGNLYFSQASGGDGYIYKLTNGDPSVYYLVKLSDVGTWAGDFAFDKNNVLYLSTGNSTGSKIYRVDDGIPKAVFSVPSGECCIKGINFDSQGNLFYASWSGGNIYQVSLSDQKRTLIYSNPNHTWLSDVWVKSAVTCQHADISPTISGLTSVYTGEEIGSLLSVTVTNSGNQDAGSFFVGIYISSDSNITVNDTLLTGGRESVSSLGSGKSASVSLYSGMKIPDSVIPGSYYLGVIADEFDAVSECDENDNTDSTPVTILASSQPSLSVDPASQEVPASGGNTTFNISNTGDGTMAWTASENSDWFSIDPISGTNNGTIIVNCKGNSNLGDRTGTITITASGAGNSPRTVEVRQKGLITRNYIISGKVKDADGKGIYGVTISLSNNGGSAATDLFGNYSIQVIEGWSGTATPTKDNESFDPQDRSYTGVNSDQTGQDYILRKPVLSVTPDLQEVSIAGGVTIFNVSNTGYGTMVWTASENSDWFSISPVSGTDHEIITVNCTANINNPGDRSGSITITASGSYNSPQTVTVLQKGLKAYTISGKVKYPDGNGINGATITFSNNGGSATTDNLGNYSIQVREGRYGTATPTKTGYSFDPKSSYYSPITSNQSQDYTGRIYTLSRNNHVINRTGNTGDNTTWVIEMNGTISRQINAANSLSLDLSNYSSGRYRIWLKQFIDGKYVIVSNIIEYVSFDVNIYPEDNYLAVRPVVYKAEWDLLDIVVRITNKADTAVNGITLKFVKDSGLSDLARLYRRSSPDGQSDEISGYGVSYDGNNKTIYTIDNIYLSRGNQSEFVFRFIVNTDRGIINSEAVISGDNVADSSHYMNNKIRVISDGKIIITNRELMYRSFPGKAAGVNQLWQTLYRIASDRRAIIYHLDKYDRDYDGNRDDIPTIDWFYDRLSMANGSGGTYEYGNDPASRDEPSHDPNDNKEEENRINLVAFKIKNFLQRIIDFQGGVGNGKYVAILGGDSVIPFYRAFDPSNTVFDFKNHHNATDVTRTDASNNYLFTDIFYRDYNGGGWDTGNVENLFVGRITGTSPQNMEWLLLSSDEDISVSDNVVKLENNMRNCELASFAATSDNAGYNVVTDIDGVSIDVDNPKGCYPNRKGGIDDLARWTDFQDLFTGNASNVADFDIMRFMCHGSVNGIQSSEDGIPKSNKFFSPYFTGSNIFSSATNIRSHFSSSTPFFIFDACLVGLVDGSSTAGLLNSLLPLNVGGILASSGVTWTPNISDFGDAFTKSFIDDGLTSGKSLCIADRTWGSNNAKNNYSKLEMNLFGLPWSAVTPPDDRSSRRSIRTDERIRSSSIRSAARSINEKTISVDSSQYHIEHNEFDVVMIDQFELLLKDTSTPVIPYADFTLNVPLNAIIDSVDVAFSNPINLGTLNIPAFQPPPPMPDPEGLYPPGGYVTCPGNLGVYPSSQFSYKVAEIIGYNQVIVEVFPLTFDTASKQASLYESAVIKVTYTTPDKGLVRQFTSDKRIYTVKDSIITTSLIENTSATGNNFNVSVQLQDIEGNILASNQGSQTIDSNTAGSIPVNLTSPSDDGIYQLVMTASDGTNNIGSSVQDIKVISGKIVSFTSNINAGSDSLFTMNFQNLSDTAVNVSKDIYIYNAYDEQVDSVSQEDETLNVGEIKEFNIQWNSESISWGTYKAQMVITVNDDSFSQLSEPFFIVRLSDAILVLQVLTGMETDNIGSDIDGDNNIGLAEVIYIIQTVSGLR